MLETIAEAVSRAKAQIEAKNPELENKERPGCPRCWSWGYQFYDLKTDRTNRWLPTLEAMVSFEGETGPYVPIRHTSSYPSILRKADFKPGTIATTA